MERMITRFQKVDHLLFYKINGSKQLYRSFFGFVTHLGGARFTIGIMLLLLLLSIQQPLLNQTSLVAGFSLIFSHVVMSIIKKMVKRIRPYLTLPNAMVHGYAFKDHSFPSGHSTAIFSITTPFMIQYPSSILILLPISWVVAYSRVVLGVHYPSDVVAGALLAIITTIGVTFMI
ncbi:phosphatase PAP2 family protein [Rossellomorea aquimaris]|uniref:phosphatase PAP2 family protein n=1 Tax=Rossellomorea aquimaris TaxID=189382 RepID=UPI0007D08712|nr:phosphatase PAP2 family protein [Rossellomorea aquimaris]